MAPNEPALIVLLGPVPCTKCKALLVWARPGNSKPSQIDLIRWRDNETWHIHICEGDTK